MKTFPRFAVQSMEHPRFITPWKYTEVVFSRRGLPSGGMKWKERGARPFVLNVSQLLTFW
jgi:hypothetical protein